MFLLDQKLVPRDYDKWIKMLSNNEARPLIRQFYPDPLENIEVDGFGTDPLEEESFQTASENGFIHKYPTKLLILISEECLIRCRYCTRKRIVFNKSTKFTEDKIKQTVEYIKNHTQIQELIFSGGDPFYLSVDQLLGYLSFFVSLEQIKKIRFHTRAITISPQIFSETNILALSSLIARNRNIKFTIVLHVNHPTELRPESLSVIRNLKKIGFNTLSQSVLLRDVNDSSEVLLQLFLKLSAAGVQPYYLHQLDRVQGAAHFEVPVSEGIKFMKEVRKKLVRCLIPAYVTDSKTGKKPLL